MHALKPSADCITNKYQWGIQLTVDDSLQKDDICLSKCDENSLYFKAVHSYPTRILRKRDPMLLSDFSLSCTNKMFRTAQNKAKPTEKEPKPAQNCK